ncbi:HAMP domain-containing histidine kinase (plasmid) [Embleya sp. NBC_00888]|uniref:sensor histidine kinase n=1 Tax=Embleya sp. NBC_00888 TaxID=2975960 RepID=UPI002F911D31|nr:HAMP domain-containing histidine kinase [Embleya sp. NBC_00888]
MTAASDRARETRRRPAMRLSTRIALAVGVLVPLLVIAAGTLVVRWVTADVTHRQDVALRQRADHLAPDARALVRAVENERENAVRARENRLLDGALDLGVRVELPGGPVSAGPQPPAGVPLPDARRRSPVTVRAGGKAWRMVSRPLGATGTLRVFQPTSETDARTALLRRRVFVVAGFAVPVSALAGLAVGSTATRSLRALRRRAAAIEPDDAARPDVHIASGVAEVDDLGRTLAAVLGRYDTQTARTREALETARAFAATVDHELRGPLTGMRTDLDVLATYPELAPAERTEIVTDLAAGQERILSLLASLRALAQGDLADGQAFERVDLGELAHAAARDARTHRPDADLVVSAPKDEVRIDGLGPGLRLLLDNLIGNALVHGRGPDGAVSIRIGVEAGEDGARIRVDDDGPGIPVERRDAVFERFRRGPDSPGAGLGLTLVAQQVALHLGRVTVGTPPTGRGTRVEVVLPLRRPDVEPNRTRGIRHDWLTREPAARTPGG